MLGDLIGRGLFMILGYAYPAFECFKTVERNQADIHQLRFWCQYWIIVALLSVCERFGDIFISWLPLYGEIKLAFIIYLWYPKTKGTSYVYESILRPLVSKHETDIDKHLHQLRFRVWDLAIYYYQNCTDLGQSAFFNLIHYIANHSTRLNAASSIQNQGQQGSPSPPSSVSGIPTLRQRKPKPESPAASPQHLNRRWPPPIVDQPAPSAPPTPATFPALFKDQPHPSNSKVEVNDVHTEYVHVDQLYQHDDEPTKEKRHTSSRFNFLRPNKT